MVTKDDLDLIDALVWAGCISRAAARDVAKSASAGKVATYIHEKGLAPAIAPPQVILDRIRWAEQAEDRLDDSVTIHVRAYPAGDTPETD